MASRLTKNLGLPIPDVNDKGTIISDVVEPAFDKIDQYSETTDLKISQIDTGLSKKEPVFVKKSGFNLDKSNAIDSDREDIIATSKAVKSVNEKKLDKTGGSISGDLEITGNTKVPYITIGGYKVEVV